MAIGRTSAPATGSLGPTDRLELLPVCTRLVGRDLLLARPGPWRDVARLTGTGPLLWGLFGEGLDLEGAARSAAAAAGVTIEETRADVVAFATELVARDLARPT